MTKSLISAIVVIDKNKADVANVEKVKDKLF